MVDYHLMIFRLRPTSAYHNTGLPGYAAIGEWRDQNTNKPTEVECLAEWEIYLQEQAAIEAERQAQEQAESDAVTGYATLPDWARVATAQDAADYINLQIFDGRTEAQVHAWIDQNITGTTVAQLRAQVITALKVTATAIINTRGLFIFVAKLLLYVRDLVIRFRA